MKTIGMLGGISWESTASDYRALSLHHIIDALQQRGAEAVR